MLIRVGAVFQRDQRAHGYVVKIVFPQAMNLQEFSRLLSKKQTSLMAQFQHMSTVTTGSTMWIYRNSQGGVFDTKQGQGRIFGRSKQQCQETIRETESS